MCVQLAITSIKWLNSVEQLVTSPVQLDTVIKPSILLSVLFVNRYADIVLIFLRHVLIAIRHCFCLKIRQLTFLVSQNVLNIIILIEQEMILALFAIYRVKIVPLYRPNVLLVTLGLIFITFNALIRVLLNFMEMM